MRNLITCTPHQVLDDKEDDIGGACSAQLDEEEYMQGCGWETWSRLFEISCVDERIVLKYTLKIQNEKGRTIFIFLNDGDMCWHLASMARTFWLVCMEFIYVTHLGIFIDYYSKTCLKRNLKGPEHFSAKARFPFNQGTLHIKIKPGHACIWDKIKHHTR